jgi:hypothetical protein
MPVGFIRDRIGVQDMIQATTPKRSVPRRGRQPRAFLRVIRVIGDVSLLLGWGGSMRMILQGASARMRNNADNAFSSVAESHPFVEAAGRQISD